MTDDLRLATAHPKIRSRHLERKALVYVRQSTLEQLIAHPESTRLQYALADRAHQLGWTEDHVETIDDDLGRSGTSIEGRPGFQRLVAAVGLGQVGIVLGREMSRLARSCRDWHQLIDICTVCGTLLADVDGVYDPSEYNDRLLLGLKGTMSEAELHLLKRRMLDGRRAKASRGELHIPLPMGYIRHPSGEAAKDPDEEAQTVLTTIFEQFVRQGSAHALLRYLVAEGIHLPIRQHRGPDRGNLVWRRPTLSTLRDVLKNPAYAGAYAYGRRPVNPRKKKPGHRGSGRETVPMDQWHVLLQDQHPAYISWEDYLANQDQLRANQPTHRGRPRPGATWVAGLVYCGRCGCRMQVQYSGRSGRYRCVQAALEYGDPLCQSLVAGALDQAVAEQALAAVQPAALAVSLEAVQEAQTQRDQRHQRWKQRRERAQQAVNRTWRQYDAVEPENRLVARTLERQWEEQLRAQARLEESYQEYLQQQPLLLTTEEQEAIRSLAHELPRLWTAPTTTSKDRKEILRCLLDKVVVTVQGQSERVNVEIYWAGGHRTEHAMVRPVRTLSQLSYGPALKERVQWLRKQGTSWKEVAQDLNGAGWQPPQLRGPFTAAMVRSRFGRRPKKMAPSPPSVDLEPQEWTVQGLAQELEMPEVTLLHWIKRGWVKADKRPVQGRRLRWVIQADEEECARLRHFRTLSPSDKQRQRQTTQGTTP